MGHLGNLKAEYRALAARLGTGIMAFPAPDDPRAFAGFQEVLEILYPPDLAALAARLPLRPASVEDLARRLGIPVATLRPQLDAMCDRGIAMDLVNPKTGEARYFLSPPLGGFVEFAFMRAHDAVPKRRLAEALEAYFHGDETFAREVFDRATPIGRAVVHEGGLEEDTPDVLEWERATELIREARTRAVSLCYCRHKAQHLERACDAPVEACLSLNAGAEFVARRGFGRGLDILAAARARGLVQIADNVQRRPVYICNCCACCCEQLQAINTYGLPGVRASGFLPVVDEARCKGCARCARACPVTALTMAARRVAATRQNRLTPGVDEARCLGCGVCADVCPNQALRMRRAARPQVPRNGLERALLMALERGCLAELLLEGGTSRGARFLREVLHTLEGLPPVQRALANEQLRSRFVSFVLRAGRAGA
jgi:ferredoxin